MSATLLAGQPFAAQIKAAVKARVDNMKEQHGITPGLAVIMAGDNAASSVYVASKHRACNEIGIRSEIIRLAEDSSKAELLAHIERLNNDDTIHGILVQLPLPAHVEQAQTEILEAVHPMKDVDGFHPVNVGKLATGQECLVPCTPAGCMKMLELAGIAIEGKQAVVVGRSNIVGKPLFHLLLARNATVTVCHSRSRNLAEITKTADILIAAVGKPNFITSDMVKPGAVVIDVGINRIAGKKLVGDVDFEQVSQVAGAITPVPGGVGLLTIAMLLDNTCRAACLLHDLQI